MNGGSKFTPLRTSLVELEAAAHDREADAEKLFRGRRYASTIAMAIYSLEIHLKVAICKRLDLDGLPRAFEIHNLDGLLYVTGLKRRMESPAFVKVKYNWDQIVLITDNIQQGKQSDLRYSPSDRYSRKDAQEVIERVFDSKDGVVPWIKAQPQSSRGAKSRTP